MKIAVLGGGHGGYAAAADLTLRGYEVCLFTFSAARVETLHNNDNVISYTGVWGEGSCRVAHVSNSMEEAVSGADLVVMNVPGTVPASRSLTLDTAGAPPRSTMSS